MNLLAEVFKQLGINNQQAAFPTAQAATMGATGGVG